jgi:hypothetical protein
LKEDRPKKLNGIKVRETDTFTYALNGKWKGGFKTIPALLKDMLKHHPKSKFYQIDFHARIRRGERVR